MKKMLVVVIAVMVVMISVVGFSQSSGIPSKGDYTVPGNFVGEFKVLETTEKTVSIQVPLPSDTKDWQIYASRAWTDGKSWYLESQNDYSVATSSQNNGLTATIPLSDKGNGWHWLRIWGKEKDWLPIEVTDPFVRNDTQGNPAYEVLVNGKTKEAQVVPKVYPGRK